MTIPATRPYFSQEDIDFITEKFQEILRGESYLSTFKHTEEFEERFADAVGTRYAVGCNSGTSALELLFRGLEIEGKEVILPSNTFIATANAILNAGGELVFADCGDDMCMDADDVIGRITDRTAAIVPVHIGGIVSESVPKLQEVCQRRDIFLVEDAAQAHGSALRGTKAGAFGAGAGFSFFSTKVMTTGEGGMVTTNDADLSKRMKSLREFGKVKTGIYINLHKYIGYNWRMPEVAALMGLRQLASLPEFIRRRQEIARIYDEELSDHPDIVLVEPADKSTHNYFKYLVLLPNHDREPVHRGLQERGVSPSGYVYELPLHKQPVFPWANALSLPKTEDVCRSHFCLPIFYGLTDEQAVFVAGALRDVLK